MAALSYDSVRTLAHFANRVGISYPLLADVDSRAIRELGILNDTIPPDDRAFGIPYPGAYLIEADLTVKAKFFEDQYRDRYTAASVMLREFGESGTNQGEANTKHLSLRWGAANARLGGGQRTTLELGVMLPEKMHVYAPEVKNYRPIAWEIEPSEVVTVFDVEYPASKSIHLPAIGETVPVYEGEFRLVRDVRVENSRKLASLLDEEGRLTIRGTFRYQACDDKVCYLPTAIPLQWTLQIESHDRKRVPQEESR